MSRVERYEIESREKWNDYFDAMDFIELRPNYLFKVIPAVGGAILRFRIKYFNNEFSIYFDALNSLGYMNSPYFEVHPNKEGDCSRSYDFKDLLKEIYEICEGEDIIKSEMPEMYI